MTLELRPLTEPELELVHATMLDAFADYPIPMQPPLAAFELLVRRRGVAWPLSIGAFEGDALLGFTLTARRGVRAYDVMTGVRRSAQGRGLVGALFEALWPRLRARGVERMQLEVITTNTRALRAYERIGFVPARRLICLRWAGPFVERAPKLEVELELREVESIDWPRWSSASQLAPAWPSERETIERCEPRVVLEAWVGGEPGGFAIACGSDLLQLAVVPALRRRGIASALLEAIAGRSSTPLRVLNVDAAASGVLAWLTSRGAQPFVEQLELVRELA